MLENRWTMLAVVFVTRTSMGFMFQSVASISPFLLDQFGLSYGQVGFLMGLFLLPGVFLALPGGVLGQRFSSRGVAAGGLALMIVGGVVTAASSSFVQACVGRAIAGAGGVLLNLLLAKMVADWFTGKEISTAMGVMLSSWPVGIGLALATLGSVATRWSWRVSLLVTVGAAAAGLLLLGALYRNPPRVAAPARERLRVRPDLSRRAWALAVSAGLCWTALNASFIVVASFGPAYLMTLGASVAQAGSSVSAGIWASLVSVPLGGYVADRLRRPNLLISLGALATALCIALVPVLPGPVIWFVLAGTLLGLAPGAIMALLPEALEARHVAPAFGVLYTIFYFGLALAQPLAGMSRDLSGNAAMPLFFAAAMMATTVAALGLFRGMDRRHPRRNPPEGIGR